ncbi:MAG: hypothetical protein HC866_21945 [Leptolyngbyaceae cyanobacterium RU_5_1]|nr:hypothetical protein [Leptolyngbyaceae cyanobacterium RU_5_1]
MGKAVPAYQKSVSVTQRQQDFEHVGFHASTQPMTEILANQISDFFEKSEIWAARIERVYLDPGYTRDRLGEEI